jgi:nucleoside-diphosphate-sugar epimerase
MEATNRDPRRNKIKALVTGAGNFLAKSLIDRLLSLGFGVRAFDIHEVTDPIEDVEYIFGDITKSSILSDISKGVDYIFHLLKIEPRDKKEKGKNGKLGLTTAIKLANIANSLNVSAFVYLSGSEVYGIPRRDLIEEDSERRPISKRGKEDLLVENYLIDTVAPRGLPVIILRSAPITGWGVPKDMHQSIYLNFRNALIDKPVYLIGGGKYLVQYVDVEDLTTAMVRCIRKVKEGYTALNVAAADIITERKLAEQMIYYYNSRSRLVSYSSATLPIVGLLRALGNPPIGTDYYHLIYPQTIIDPSHTIELLEMTPKKITESISEMTRFWEDEIQERGMRRDRLFEKIR